MYTHLQTSALIQPRTSPPNFGNNYNCQIRLFWLPGAPHRRPKFVPIWSYLKASVLGARMDGILYKNPSAPRISNDDVLPNFRPRHFAADCVCDEAPFFLLSHSLQYMSVKIEEYLSKYRKINIKTNQCRYCNVTRLYLKSASLSQLKHSFKKLKRLFNLFMAFLLPRLFPAFVRNDFEILYDTSYGE